MNKTKTLFNILGQLLVALWKLFMVGLYALSKIAEALSRLLVKISEKFID